MRVMVLVKANEQSERGELPSEKLLSEMTAYNEELVKAGVMLAGEGLHPSSKGARVRFSGDKRTVIRPRGRTNPEIRCSDSVDSPSAAGSVIATAYTVKNVCVL